MALATPSRTTVLLTVLLALLPALLWGAPHPAAAEEPAPRRSVSAWLPYWDQEAAYQNALRHADQLHTVSPFWYETKAADRIAPHTGAGDRVVIDGLHQAGIDVVPTVMESLPSGALAAVVTDPARRAAHADALLATALSRDYDGLDLDYESLATTGDATYAAVRDGYAALVTDVCARLHARARTCVVTVMPKTATGGRVWDYATFGKVADRVRIMGYNLHWAGGPAGPLSTPRWYDEMLRTATALVPPERIEVGLPAYGWDWPPAGPRTATAATGTAVSRDADGTGATHVTWKEAEALRRAHHVPYRLDPASSTPHFTYSDGERTREVWYQDARGVAGHLPVLRRYGIVHTALWALNFEDPALWPVLAQGAPRV
ncbi:glycosyl hydrolase [Streptomyces sp. QHH-9511]|uniref:glycosyl hydrolase family 18 protein n=1 Tax=Streptomyces sp. QHH-9511 TaxID=2684468 RepID=UPI001316D51A|nr:glycosyl hydrolase family 18 protein [Streptomyces sp. QHH-9511]QGZ52043.1 glycosyl hydrolase [Streptomyces sp. QHH-9511]